MAKPIKLFDSHGNPITANKPPVHERVIAPGARFTDSGGFELKASVLAAAVKAANGGQLMQQAMVVRSMFEMWPHLRAEFGKLKLSVGFTPTEILPDPDAENEAQMARNVELCKSVMRKLNRRRLAMELTDARAYSIEVQELGWQATDSQWLIRSTDHIDQESIGIDSETGRYTVFNADTMQDEVMEGYRYMVATNSEYSGHPFRGGQFRALVWWYLLYRQNLTELYQFLQIYGLPFRFAVGDTTDKDAVTAVEAGLQKLGADAYAVFDSKEGWQIEIKTMPEATHSLFRDVRDMANEEASKICVGQTLTAQPGTSGSWALGTVHEGVAQRIRESACGDVAEAIEDGIFWPLVYYNFGPEAAEELPVYKFHCEPPEDLKAISGLYDNLHGKMGMWPTIPLKHLHDRFSVPSTREIGDDEVAVPMEIQVAIVAAMFGQADPAKQLPASGKSKTAAEPATRPRGQDAFEGIVKALSMQESGGAFSREAAKITDIIGKQVKSGGSITDAQRAIARYATEHEGDPQFSALMYRVLGVAKSMGYYDAKFRAAQEVERLK